jgi:membrane protein required for colicin V production
MNTLDCIILGLIGFFVVKGFFMGIFREIFSLAGIVFGFLIGNHYHPQMADLLGAYIPLEDSLPLISFFALFIMVCIVFNLFGSLLHRMFKTLFVGWFDRGLGVCLALIKGTVISYLLIVLLTVFVPSSSPLIATSRVAPLVKLSFESMRMLISPDLYRMWERRISKESEKMHKAVTEGKEAVKDLPRVLPDEGD